MPLERGQHDLGGLPGGPIDLEEHELLPWHKTISAVFTVMRLKGEMTIDELRRCIEDVPPEIYDGGYYERWTIALTDLMVEKRLITRDEVDAKMAALRRAREAAE